MGTKANGDVCYEVALPDEPMFVLLARDITAPDIVREWARKRLLQIETGNKPASDIEKVYEALMQACKMELWRSAYNGSWRPIEPPELTMISR